MSWLWAVAGRHDSCQDLQRYLLWRWQKYISASCSNVGDTTRLPFIASATEDILLLAQTYQSISKSAAWLLANTTTSLCSWTAPWTTWKQSLWLFWWLKSFTIGDGRGQLSFGLSPRLYTSIPTSMHMGSLNRLHTCGSYPLYTVYLFYL